MKHIEIKHYAPPIDVKEMERILLYLDPYIVPRLSGRVNIENYARKLATYADIFNLEIEGKVVGNLAIYLNSEEGFLTSIAICPEYQGLGYGRELWERAQELAINKKITAVCLEVYTSNISAKRFYLNRGFQIQKKENDWIRMKKILGEERICLK